MPSTKRVLFKGKKLSDDRHPILVRITHNRKSRYVSTGFSAFPEEWDEKACMFTDTYKRNLKLSMPKFEQLKKSLLDKHTDIIDKMLKVSNDEKRFILGNFKETLKASKDKPDFFKFTKEIIEENMRAQRVGNAAAIRNTMNVIEKFQGGKRLDIENITWIWIKAFETWHLSKGNKMGSFAVYARTLKSIINRAILKQYMPIEAYPFSRPGVKGYTIQGSPARKRAIDKEAMIRLKKLEFPVNTDLWHARNYFLFSFYCMGMNFTDMAHLKLSNIVENRIEYTRRKTMRRGDGGKVISIAITPQIKEIIDLYSVEKGSEEYIFPIIERPDDPELVRKDVNNKCKTYNKYLKIVAEKAKIEGGLTSYVSRHSFATISKHLGINIGTISDSLGHSNAATTEKYLKSMDTETIDQAALIVTEL